MRKYGKIVGGFPHYEGKNLIFPNEQSLDMSIKDEKDWVTIQVQKTRKRDQDIQK